MHPTISTFGQSQTGEFPLLLVIGREPNFEGTVVNEVRSFPLNHAPHCCFWNRSRAQLARIGGHVTSANLKNLCYERDASPLIYADSLGICIPFRDANRDKLRAEWAHGSDRVVAHVTNVFSHAIINRVSLVLLSGLDNARHFEGSFALINQKCLALGIPVQPVPFFGARGPTKLLDASLTHQTKQLMESIYNEFLT